MTITWMTKPEAAKHLRVSTATIDRYVRRGLLTRHKLAGTQSARFRKDELDALVEPEIEEVPDDAACLV